MNHLQHFLVTIGPHGRAVIWFVLVSVIVLWPRRSKAVWHADNEDVLETEIKRYQTETAKAQAAQAEHKKKLAQKELDSLAWKCAKRIGEPVLRQFKLSIDPRLSGRLLMDKNGYAQIQFLPRNWFSCTGRGGWTHDFGEVLVRAKLHEKDVNADIANAVRAPASSTLIEACSHAPVADGFYHAASEAYVGTKKRENGKWYHVHSDGSLLPSVWDDGDVTAGRLVHCHPSSGTGVAWGGVVTTHSDK